MEEQMPIDVFVKYDKDGNIIDIQSSVFLTDTKGYTKIDSGYGDKYAHAQHYYFDKELKNIDGTYNFKRGDIK